MPRIATVYGKDPKRMPFEFSEVLLMAKNNVDGVYEADPHKVPGALSSPNFAYIFSPKFLG